MNNKLMKIVPKSILGKVSRQILKTKKNAPHIFFVAGVAGTVASTVLACRATLKLSSTLDEIKHDIEEFQAVPVLEGEELDHHYEAIRVYGRASFKLVKLYGPAILVGTASTAALTGSHIQMARRNAALMAAYTAVQTAYDNYRDRVREEFGSEKELDIYHAAKNELVKGSDDKISEAKIVDPNKYSPYAKFFDEFSPNWSRDPEVNRMFVQCQQNYANNLLLARKHVFLNEVYDMLGIERSRAGQVVGWVIGGDGDNYIDFGLFEAYNSQFVNGTERSILLDFNVDGIVYDKI